MRERESGLFSACVQNGLGTACGMFTDIGAAELACDAQSRVTRHFAAETGPGRLVPNQLRDIGANAPIRWKEWRARRE